MEEGIRHTFPKEERICGKTSIERLIARGRHASASPLKYCFLTDNGQGCNRVIVSVPKKFFKRAVKRNLFKRRIRESWRKQKHMLPKDGNVDVLITYATKEISDYQTIYESVGRIVENISKHVRSKRDQDGRLHE